MVGIVTERDYVRKLADKAGSAQVRDIMTYAVIHVSPDHTSDHCIVRMAQNHLRHLPVIFRNRLKS